MSSPIHRGAPRDVGSITAFVVVIAMTVLMCGGLVVDGGRILGARVEVADQAENAARAGAQEIMARDGVVVLDIVRARQAALQFLAAAGADGTVVVTLTRITVTVRATVDTTLLSLARVGSKTVVATRSSDPITQ